MHFCSFNYSESRQLINKDYFQTQNKPYSAFAKYAECGFVLTYAHWIYHHHGFSVVHYTWVVWWFLIQYTNETDMFSPLHFSPRCRGSPTNTTQVFTAWWSWHLPKLCPPTSPRSLSWTRTSPSPLTSLSCGAFLGSLQVKCYNFRIPFKIYKERFLYWSCKSYAA